MAIYVIYTAHLTYSFDSIHPKIGLEEYFPLFSLIEVHSNGQMFVPVQMAEKLCKPRGKTPLHKQTYVKPVFGYEICRLVYKGYKFSCIRRAMSGIGIKTILEGLNITASD